MRMSKAKTLKDPELKFRKFVDTQMEGLWKMTWHEDREISPGVPDLHYVMVESGARFCVGWLELKAIDVIVSKSKRIGVEASQHQYIRRWADHMPIHFLIRAKDYCYVVDGRMSPLIPVAGCEADMRIASVIHFHESDLTWKLAEFLRSKTRML